jgi:FO synthase
VKLGPDGVSACLRAGANDVGGTLMNESITRAAGAAHGQEFPPLELERLIVASGRIPWQRTTLYAEAPEERRAAALRAGALTETVNTPVKRSTAAARRAGIIARDEQALSA